MDAEGIRKFQLDVARYREMEAEAKTIVDELMIRIKGSPELGMLITEELTRRIDDDIEAAHKQGA